MAAQVRIVSAALASLFVWTALAAAEVSQTTVNDVRALGKGNDARVEITATAPINSYTYYKMPKPLRAIIEIARSQPGVVKPVAEINEGAIARVLVEKKEMSVFTTTRVTVELKKDGELSISSDNSGKKLIISFPGPASAATVVPAQSHLTPAVKEQPENIVAAQAPAASAPAKSAPSVPAPAGAARIAPVPAPAAATPGRKGVTREAPAPIDPRLKAEPPRSASGAPSSAPARAVAAAAKPAGRGIVNNIRVSGNTVEIIGRGIDSYKTFTLSNPGRLVIDIPNISNGLKTKRAPLNLAAVRWCRIGEEGNKVRIVFDYAKGAATRFKVEKKDYGLRVIFAESARK